MLCCVCLLENPNNMGIFDDIGQQLKIAEVIHNHLWFKPQPDDILSTKICTICWQKIYEFHIFYQTVQKAHMEHEKNSLTNIKIEISCSSPMKLEEEFVINNNDASLIEPIPVKVEQEDGEEFVDNNDASLIEPKDEMQIINSLEENSSETSSVGQSDDEYEPSEDSETSDSSQQNFSEEKEFLSGGDDTLQGELTPQKKIDNNSKPNLEKDKDSTKNSLDPINIEAIIRKHIPMTCNKCNFVGATFSDIVQHFKNTHSNVRPYITCCDRKFFKRSVIAEHALNHDKDPIDREKIIRKHIPMTCNLCNFVGTTFSDIVQHFNNSHPKVKPYIKCCDRIFFKRSVAAEHALNHEDPNYYRCEKCNKSFTTAQTLRKHNLTYHARSEDLIYACDKCPKKFATTYILNLHTANKHKSLIHICPVCTKEFRDKEYYKKHLRSHYSPRKCPYTDCDTWIKGENNFKKHLISHSPDGKLYKCDECDKEFINRKNLRSHKYNVHTNKPFQCDQCDKTFRKNISLREHLAQHSGETLYQCQFCNKSFASSASMCRHNRIYHPIEYGEWKNKRKNSQKSN